MCFCNSCADKCKFSNAIWRRMCIGAGLVRGCWFFMSFIGGLDVWLFLLSIKFTKKKKKIKSTYSSQSCL
ncbi:hypothetical protein HanIR_Chr13g0625021 [Helianthus annuus]|nr:hypothetical protein HanIR_Chr13g0625021 [Helianthus annuus]